MGIGDRHSRRVRIDRARVTKTASGTIDLPGPMSAADASPVVAIAPKPLARQPDARELDDPFSAWDEDDAGALTPAPAPLAQSSTSALADPAIKLVDPVSMVDIEISRTATIDDPLTTGLLAEISRSDLMNDHLPRPRPGPGLPTAAVVRRTRDMSPGEISHLIDADEELAQAAHDQDVHRRVTRQSVIHPVDALPDEPSPKK